MTNKSLSMLGLAKKAGLLQIGEEPVGIACRAGRARLLVLACDSADHTLRRAKSFCKSGKPPILMLPYSKAELGDALGCNACAMCVFCDAAFAKSFLECLEPRGENAQILEVLSRQTERIQKRRAEQKAHQKNLKHGKK